jgi:hypothetical protein
MLIKKKLPVEKTPTALLYDEMKEALQNYSKHLKHYYAYLEEDVDSGSPYAQLLLQRVEVHRERYFKLRMQYEVHNGDPVDYRWKLTKFFKWRKENNIQCLAQNPYDKYTILSSLDSQLPTRA